MHPVHLLLKRRVASRRTRMKLHMYHWNINMMSSRHVDIVVFHKINMPGVQGILDSN